LDKLVLLKAKMSLCIRQDALSPDSETWGGGGTLNYEIQISAKENCVKIFIMEAEKCDGVLVANLCTLETYIFLSHTLNFDADSSWKARLIPGQTVRDLWRTSFAMEGFYLSPSVSLQHSSLVCTHVAPPQKYAVNMTG
jgi:hypothetical protein